MVHCHSLSDIKLTRFSDVRGRLSRLVILEILLFIKLRWVSRWQLVKPCISEILLSVKWKIKGKIDNEGKVFIKAFAHQAAMHLTHNHALIPNYMYIQKI